MGLAIFIVCFFTLAYLALEADRRLEDYLERRRAVADFDRLIVNLERSELPPAWDAIPSATLYDREALWPDL